MAIRDLGSSNGTWVGNQRVSRAKLRVGDVVRFGSVMMRVVERLDPRMPHADQGHATAFAPSPVHAEALEEPSKTLSDNDNVVLRLVLDGLQYKQIARHLKLPPRRLYRRVQAIYAAFHVRSRGELMSLRIRP